MFRRLINKVKAKGIIRRLNKLSADAFALNETVRKSKMPDEVKARCKIVMDFYYAYLNELYIKENN